MARMDGWFEVMLERGGSDLLIAEGQPPKLRVTGHIVALDERVLPREEVDWLLEEICPAEMWRTFKQTSDLDFAYELPGRARFRVNYYRHHAGIGGVFRVIPTKILSLEELGAPAILRDMARLRSG